MLSVGNVLAPFLGPVSSGFASVVLRGSNAAYPEIKRPSAAYVWPPLFTHVQGYGLTIRLVDTSYQIPKDYA